MTFDRKEDYEHPKELIYRCGDCGWLQARGKELPGRCPDCNAPREHFELVEED